MGYIMFSGRHPGYKIGVVVLCIGVLLFILGFASQHWTATTKRPVVDGLEIELYMYNGLWAVCYHTNLTMKFKQEWCRTATDFPEYISEWFTAVQGLQCVTLIGFVAAAGLAIIMQVLSSCRTKFYDFPVIGRAVEILCLAFSLIGVVSVAVYGAKQPGRLNYRGETDWEMITVEFTRLSWAFALDVVGLGFVFLAGILMAVFNRPFQDQDGDADSLAVEGSKEAEPYENVSNKTRM